MITFVCVCSVAMRRASRDRDRASSRRRPGGTGLPRSPVAAGPALSGASMLELGQEAGVVLVEEADIVDPVASHAEPLDPETEGEAGYLVGVVAHRAEDIGVNHPRTT